MLSYFSINHKKFYTTTEKINKDENLFTVIVGKNGTGKSRLLKSLVEEFIDPKRFERQSIIDRRDRSLSKIETKYDHQPSSVIAVSTSPFDRFPLTEDYRLSSEDLSLSAKHYPPYEYLGLRGLYSNNLSLSFMNRVITSLIESIIKNNDHAEKIYGILDYLGYDGSIKVTFRIPHTLSKIDEILKKEPSLSALADFLHNKKDVLKIHAWDEHPLDENITEITESLRKFIKTTRIRKLNILINRYGLSSQNSENLFTDNNIITLLKLGIIKLHEVILTKKYSFTEINLNEASSGEQSVVLGFLGVAAHITDGALICIDEPEICLHPEWQERYIQLLISTFRRFKRCHFIIATHSPQIVSRLEDENCFVLNIETKKIVDAKNLNRRSSDFQLATTFGAPGYKNEYLSREIITLLTYFSKSGKLSKEQISLAHELLVLKPTLDIADPVEKLMSMLEEVIKESQK